MPLPPRISLAHATVSRHLEVQNAFDSAAWASLSLPSACNCAWLTIRHCDAVMFSILPTLKPGVVLFSTMNTLTCLSARSRAQMIETSHHGALPIQRFSPLRIQVSPSRFAVVSKPPDAPEPTNGSVRPKQPIFSKRAIGGSHFCFCSSDPSI